MRKVLLVVAALSLCVGPGLPAQAAAKCATQKNGKCVTVKSKPKAKTREDFSEAERAKILEEVRKICVKKYGATSRVYHLDYTRKQVTCTPPGY